MYFLGHRHKGSFEVTVFTEFIVGLHTCYPTFSHQIDLGFKSKLNYFLKTAKR